MNLKNYYDKLLKQSEGIFIYEPIIEMYKNQDEEFLAFLSYKYSDEQILEKVLLYINAEINLYESQDILDDIQKITYNILIEQRRLLDNNQIDKWLNEYFIKEMSNKCKVIDDNIKSFCYIYHDYMNYYNYETSVYNNCKENLNNTLNKIYKNSRLFSKYGLIEINENSEIMDIDPPRIYLNRINKTFMLANIKKELLRLINQLQEDGYIKTIAVRVCSSKFNIYDGYYDEQVLSEALEYGQYFSINSIKEIDVTKLCNESYDNFLWIKLTDTDITFEEICSKDVRFNDSIITQVIHLEYEKKNDKYIITHLDHEFIFYNEEDYESRKTNPNIKGKQSKKLKSFIIKDACIPFDYIVERKIILPKSNLEQREKVPVLIFLLKSYFKNVELVNEYFQKCLNNKNNDLT